MGLDAGDCAPHDVAQHRVGICAAVPRKSKTVCEFLSLRPESAFGIGFGTLAVILLLQGYKRLPVVLIAVVGATAAVAALDLAPRYGVTILGPLAQGLPGFSVPWIGPADVVPVLIGDGPGMLIPLVLQSAALDDEQSADALELIEAEGAAIRERLKRIARLDVELARLVFTGRRPPTQARISSILQRMAAVRQEIVDREVAILLRVRGALKPEQRAAVSAINAKLLEVVSRPGLESQAGDTP